MAKDFKQYTHIRLEGIVEDAKADGLLTDFDIRFLDNMIKCGRNNTVPSPKQLEQFYRIIDKYESKKSGVNSSTQAFIRPRHMSVRLAWHDSKWNGRICKEPCANTYCNGDHSLLTDRIKREKNDDFEEDLKDGEIPDTYEFYEYIPPCFWSINLLGSSETEIIHKNPAAPTFGELKETMMPYSVFSWPFENCFVRNDADRKKYGKYYPPPQFEQFIRSFTGRFEPEKSVVFLYANYSNPVSIEDNCYLLIGCAFLDKVSDLQKFDVSDDVLAKCRNIRGMENLSVINWAIQYGLTLPDTGVILPYHEYLQYEEETGDDKYINEMKVIIDESELTGAFKYVNMDFEDDTSIYLLSKIKRSLQKIKGHNIITDFDTDEAIRIIDHMLTIVWENRGHFPGIEKLGALLCGEPGKLNELVNILYTEAPDNYCQKLSDCIQNPSNAPDIYKSALAKLKSKLKDVDLSATEFLRLSALDLDDAIFRNIISGEGGFTVNDAAKNPYIIYEYYSAEQNEILSAALYKIDLAMFPMTGYWERIDEIHKFKILGPERARALIRYVLMNEKRYGNCYLEKSDVEKKILEYPLFYEKDAVLSISTKLREVSGEYREIFSEGLQIVPNEQNDEMYYYLKELFEKEKCIEKIIDEQLSKQPSRMHFDVDKYIKESIKKITTERDVFFDEEAFRREREELFGNVFCKGIYVITGVPGSGKSQEVIKIVEVLKKKLESYVVLTPTGKAALRLNNGNADVKIKAMTIDKFMRDQRYSPCLYSNIIIDEMSMVDTEKLCDLFKIIDFDRVDRLIMVGDPHQLPPIGAGKPFFDIIRFLRENETTKDNIIDLETNCRQKKDIGIVDFAFVFTGKSANSEKIISDALMDKSNDLFSVDYWRTSEELHSLLESSFKAAFNMTDDRAFGSVYRKAIKLNADDPDCANVDAFQVITPYNGGFYGAESINHFFHSRIYPDRDSVSGAYGDYSKIMLTQNEYRKGTLWLSNGSSGIVWPRLYNKNYFFEIRDYATNLSEEAIVLSFAITVHKSQGSGFEHVFLIIPQKQTLMSRELIYTALTRSTKGITILIYQDDEMPAKEMLFQLIKKSYIEKRKTSLFCNPANDGAYIPDNGVSCKSKNEYIIYRKLVEMQGKFSGFNFCYEKKLELPNEIFDIHPDFTIMIGDRIIFWEHLGKLNDRKYVSDWNNRIELYKSIGQFDNLITTDDVNGINDKRLENIIMEILSSDLKSFDRNTQLSKYHYSLASSR
jgi:hypothetical protein